MDEFLDFYREAVDYMIELNKQGVQVIYYNSEDIRSKIERTGAEFRPYPEPNPTPEKINELVTNLVSFHCEMKTRAKRPT